MVETIGTSADEALGMYAAMYGLDLTIAPRRVSWGMQVWRWVIHDMRNCGWTLDLFGWRSTGEAPTREEATRAAVAWFEMLSLARQFFSGSSGPLALQGL